MATQTIDSHLDHPNSPEAAIAFFDSLPPASVEQLTGRWVGCDILTGHNFDGMLSAAGWRSKKFHSNGRAHPLVFDLPFWGEVELNPWLLPIEISSKLMPFPGRDTMLSVSTQLLWPFFYTRESHARLEIVEFRGESIVTDLFPCARFVESSPET